MLNLEDDQLQDHRHGVTDPGHSHGYDDKFPSEPANGHKGPAGSDMQDEGWDVSHSSTSASSMTGLVVEGVDSSCRGGEETRPRNMNVVFIIRVW